MTTYQLGPWIYASIPCLTSGDYANGSVGRANARALDTLIDDGTLTSAGSHRGSDVVRSWGPPVPPDDLDGEDVIILTWAYNGREYLIRVDDGASEAARDLVARVSDYPIIDEELWSTVEAEEEQEAFTSWIRADIGRALRVDHGAAVADAWDDLPSDEDWSLFLTAMAETSTCFVHDSEGPTIPRHDFAKVVSAIANALNIDTDRE